MHQRIILEKGKPLAKAKKAIIVLHGRGGSAEGIVGLAEQFADESYYILVPQATNNSWYPFGFMATESTNEPWLTDSVNWVTELIETTAKVVGFENVYLIGFSQGACLSLEVFGRLGKPLAGVASFTGGLIGDKLLINRYIGNFENTPVYIGNSDNDPHVPLSRSENSKEILEKLGAKVKLEVFPGRQHTVSEAEILATRDWVFS